MISLSRFPFLFRLVKYNACARLGQEIMEGINDRNKNPKSSTVYAKVSNL